jgi:hypothetical protein
MTKNKFTVCVSASFCNKEDLLTEIKKYALNSDKSSAYWDEFVFTTELLPECDAVLVFNTPFEKIKTSCDPAKLIAFMMEPGDKDLHSWMFKGLDQYSQVYSPVSHSANTISSHGFLGWYLHQDYNFLKILAVPAKTKEMSCIASGLKALKGHRSRLEFVNTLKQNFTEIDFFGKDDQFIPDKMTGLLPYRYSIAIENTSIDDYFTEKINDCFLTYTVPLYYGCKNIGKYFPARSFITIDIANTGKAIEQIRQLISEDDWQSRLDDLEEARELVLNKYQPLAGAANILRQIKTSEKKMVTIKPVHPGLPEKIRKAVNKFLND